MVESRRPMPAQKRPGHRPTHLPARPPPPPAPFRLNPVQEVRIRWDAGRLRLELVLKRHVKCDLLLFGSAPCSAGWSNMRRPVYLGLLLAPGEGVHDITALYLARFRAPEPNEQVFIRVCQHRHGWESPPQDLSALVPPNLPGSREAREGSEEEFSLGGLRLLRALRATLPPHSPRPHTPCTRGARSPRASVAADRSRYPQFVSIREIRVCHRRQSRRRELWRGS